MEDVVFKVYATENNEQWWASKYKYFLLVFFPPNMMIHREHGACGLYKLARKSNVHMGIKGLNIESIKFCGFGFNGQPEAAIFLSELSHDIRSQKPGPADSIKTG